MKPRNPLKQHGHKVVPRHLQEIPFWLVRLPPDLIAKVDACRIKQGHNKKVALACMAHAYLYLCENPVTPKVF